MSLMAMHVFAVTEGESYYTPWILHAVFSQRVEAETYAAEVVKLNESVRWPNVEVAEFIIDQVGHVEPEFHSDD